MTRAVAPLLCALCLFAGLAAGARGGGRFGGGGFGGGGFGGGGGDRHFGDDGFGGGSIGGQGQSHATASALALQQGQTRQQAQRQSTAEDMQHQRDKTAKDISDDYHYPSAYYGGYHGSDYAGAAALTGFALGAMVASVPKQTTTVIVEGSPYYYDPSGGVYYVQTSGGYTVVAPPVGAKITTLPAGATEIVAAGRTYAYANGAFYEAKGSSWVVAHPPLGATVSTLPAGSKKVTVGSDTYYVYGDETWFKAFYSGSQVVYVVSKKAI